MLTEELYQLPERQRVTMYNTKRGCEEMKLGTSFLHSLWICNVHYKKDAVQKPSPRGEGGLFGS